MKYLRFIVSLLLAISFMTITVYATNEIAVLVNRWMPRLCTLIAFAGGIKLAIGYANDDSEDMHVAMTIITLSAICAGISKLVKF